MKYQYGDTTYQGIQKFTLRDRKEIRERALANAEATEQLTYVMAVVQNEDIMEYWLMEQVSDLATVQQFYRDEEPWASWQTALVFSFNPYAV